MPFYDFPPFDSHHPKQQLIFTSPLRDYLYYLQERDKLKREVSAERTKGKEKKAEKEKDRGLRKEKESRGRKGKEKGLEYDSTGPHDQRYYIGKNDLVCPYDFLLYI